MSEPELNFFLSSHPSIVIYWLYNLCSCNYFLICVLYNPKGVGLGYIDLYPSYPSQCGCPFIFSCRKIFSANLLVFLINSCSTNSCNFGVSVRGGKVRVFLFCLLGHPLAYSFYA